MTYDSCWLASNMGLTHFEVRGKTLITETINEELKQKTEQAETKKAIFSRFEDLSDAEQSIFDVFDIKDEGYVIKETDDALYVVGVQDKGVLYGMFHLLRLLAQKLELTGIEVVENPYNDVRMLNHWDNMDEKDFMGSVERGYAGHSIFFENCEIVKDKLRIKAYARLLASIGINSVSINNVNVHALESQLITKKFLPEVSEIAHIFRKYGVTLFLSVNYASPMTLGGMETADPLDAGVRAWWKKQLAEIYAFIPDFGGVVVKADSEGRPGPFTYGRTHADGANMLAEALAPYDGLVFWRCFVYDCQQDWRDRKTDRARAAFDHFMPLDGTFLDNVVLQIKNGPIDFQVREPLSPLLGGMKQTNQIMEFQVTQEYLGHAKDVCFLVPQWKTYFEFDTHAQGVGSTIDKIANGSLYGRQHGGVVAVANIGNDANWTGHKLAQANFFGYGRLIWNPSLTAEAIATEWIQLTFGHDDNVLMTVKEILLNAWPTYEKYTAPLSVGFMVQPHLHYGVNIEGYEYSKWGTYHFADCSGIGVDRTKATGTGYTHQYFEPNAKLYENIETCPDELLLFFHFVPYTHVLRSGKTLIQHIYDTHFEGVSDVENFIKQWDELEGLIDAESFINVQSRFKQQLDNAKEWRDQINTYFYRKSGIADEQGRTIY
ncbi:MAG: alpha-glucuronidase [Defluviitaleaceae bacterium]|nr:alpha-glucuronidase [Defluviitaleaceae bacterium]